MVMRNDPKNPAPIFESGWSFMEFQMSLLLWHSRKKAKQGWKWDIPQDNHSLSTCDCYHFQLPTAIHCSSSSCVTSLFCLFFCSLFPPPLDSFCSFGIGIWHWAVAHRSCGAESVDKMLLRCWIHSCSAWLAPNVHPT